jgi:glyoxylate reductase
MKPRVFVVQPIPEESLDVLREVADVTVYPYVDRQISVDELVANAKRCDYLFVMHETLVPAEVIEANPDLKGIGVLGGTTGFIDFPAANARHIPIVAADPEDYLVPGGAMQTTADLTMALLLGLAYRVAESDRYCRDFRFKQEQTISLLGVGCYGKTAGLIGLGKVGTYIVPRLRAFDMNVIYTKRTRFPAEREREMGIEWVADKDEVLRRSDFVCIMVDYNPTTEKMIGARELALMKPTAYLINTGRAWIVEEQALLDALQNGTIAGAGLDVFWKEPPATHDIEIPPALYKMDNVILTPHNGDGTWDNRASRTTSVAKGIVALIKGEKPAVPVHSTINRAMFGHPKTYYDK